MYRFIRLTNTRGINLHKHWEVRDNGKVLLRINTNEDVYGDKYYITNGEGSDTHWYKTKEDAFNAWLKKGEKAYYK